MRLRAAVLLFVLCSCLEALAQSLPVTLFQRRGVDLQYASWERQPLFGGWQTLTADLFDDVDATVVDDHFEVVSRNRAGRPIVRKQRAGEWVGEWMELNAVISSPPGIAHTANGTHVIARGESGGMLHWFRPTGRTTWQGPTTIGRGLFNAGTAPALVATTGSRVVVFARGMDNGCYEAEWDGARWRGWRAIGGRFRGNFAAAYVNGRTEVYGVGMTLEMFRNWKSAARDYNATWEPFGGLFDEGIRPDAVTMGDDILLVARGTNNSLWSRTFARNWEDMTLPTSANPSIAVPTSQLLSVRPSARFRVSIDGFIVNQETNDDPRERHGARDEIYIWVQTGMAGTPVVPRLAARTRIFGDVHVFPTHIRAGSARGVPLVGADGGFMTGDRFPDRQPWLRRGLLMVPPAGDGPPTDPLAPGTIVMLPMVAWEGTLQRHGNAVVLLPMIIESDHTLTPGLDFTSILNDAATRLRSVAPGSAQAFYDAVPAFLRETIPTAFTLPAGDADRPIGMVGSGWAPQPILLTYDLAQRLVERSGGSFVLRERDESGAVRDVPIDLDLGTYVFEYRDSSAGLEGDYTLFWTIERID